MTKRSALLGLLLVAAATARPQVLVDPPEWAPAEPLPDDQTITRLFTVTNQGAKPVKVLSIAGGPGLVIRLDNDLLPPGRPVNLEVRYVPQRARFDREEKKSQVLLNLDGEPGQVRIPVRFEIIRSELKPSEKLPGVVRSGGRYRPRPGDRPITVLLFYSGGCHTCVDFRDQVYLPLQRYFASAPITFEILDSAEHDALERLNELKWQYRIEDAWFNLFAFVGEHALAGGDEIENRLYDLLLAELQHPTLPPRPPAGHPPVTGESATERRFRQLSGLGVLVAGLIDGINPCALATAVFLIALLTRLGHDGRSLLTAGLAFTAGVYATYFLLGLGLIRSFAFVGGRYKLYSVVNGAAVAVALVVAVLQIRDVVRLRRGVGTRELTMQLPLAVKQRLHGYLREHLTRPSIALGALVAGALVTVLEAICTSQVLVPTLAAVVGIPELRGRAMLLLTVYNIGFVAPLVVILILAWRGVTSERVAGWARRHLVAGKLALAGLLVALAALLLAAPRWLA